MFTRRWTDSEKKVVKDHFRYLDTDKLRQALPDRSRKSIYDMATRLGVKKAPERLTEMGREIMTKYWQDLKG